MISLETIRNFLIRIINYQLLLIAVIAAAAVARSAKIGVTIDVIWIISNGGLGALDTTIVVPGIILIES